MAASADLTTAVQLVDAKKSPPRDDNDNDVPSPERKIEALPTWTNGADGK
jgi:hypothetical protein